MTAFRPWFLKFIFHNHNIRRCVLCLVESHLYISQVISNFQSTRAVKLKHCCLSVALPISNNSKANITCGNLANKLPHPPSLPDNESYGRRILGYDAVCPGEELPTSQRKLLRSSLADYTVSGHRRRQSRQEHLSETVNCQGSVCAAH
jgi:hypothetical protein